MTPINWPPNKRIPPAVASPTGKVVWVAKSVAVVRSGYAKNPLMEPAIYDKTGCYISNVPQSIKLAITNPIINTRHFILYVSLLPIALIMRHPKHPTIFEQAIIIPFETV